uniref:Uncharacterized protein n=1 Tax=Arundo donax TaxID=35708 RepID=A0A0A9C6V5_ARUDO
MLPNYYERSIETRKTKVKLLIRHVVARIQPWC